MVSGFPCLKDVVERVNSLQADAVIGLGDIECPQLFNNFHGILGEMDSVSTFKEMDRNGLLLKGSFSILSEDFSTPYVISHFPPLGSATGIIADNREGNSRVTALLLKNRPKIIFHGHSEIQTVVELQGIKVVSVGSLLYGQYLMLDTESLSFHFMTF